MIPKGHDHLNSSFGSLQHRPAGTRLAGDRFQCRKRHVKLSQVGGQHAQEIFSEFPDLGVSTLFFKEFYYCRKCAGIASEKTCPHAEEDRLSFSGTKLRKMFTDGEVPPVEFMRPEVAAAIAEFKEPFVA